MLHWCSTLSIVCKIFVLLVSFVAALQYEGYARCSRETLASLFLHIQPLVACAKSSRSRARLPLATEATSESSVSLASALAGKMILAPLTRGGNLPFRRLCADFGCEASMGEMIFARSLLGGDMIEYARMRRAENEPFYGVQIATNQADEGIAAAKLAAEAGADFVDLNCGCPIHEATHRGLGSSLLRNPKKLAALVKSISLESPLPFSVKIRIAAPNRDINVEEMVQELRNAGAAAVTIHGRTADARYNKPADWKLIGKVVDDGKLSSSSVPIIGNGDILTWYEARQRIELSNVDAVMVGRGALTKPWIFDEFKRNATWTPSVEERVEIYYRLTRYMKEHFGDDEKGRKKAFYFLPWHFDFFCRYRPLPEAEYQAMALEAPLIQTRFDLPNSTSALENLLALTFHDAHSLIASSLWESSSVDDAIAKLTALAEGDAIATIIKTGVASDEVKELSNIPSPNKKERKRKAQKPQRTPEEIAILRAQRAEKRALTGAPPHVDGRRLRQADTSGNIT